MKGLQSFDFSSPKMIKHLKEIPKYINKEKYETWLPDMCQKVKIKCETMSKFNN